MKKLSLSVLVLLVLAMVLPCTVAAAAAPSITISDVVVVTEIAQEEGAAPLPADLIVVPDPWSATLQTVKAGIVATAKTAPAATYFGNEAVSGVLAAMPASVTVDALKVDELNALRIANYMPECGYLIVKLTTVANYTADTNIAVLVGTWVNGQIVWTPVEAYIENSVLCIKLPVEILTAANGSELIYAVLRAA